MNTEQSKLNPEAQAVYDSIHVTVRMCRWFYECGLKEGFTTKQATISSPYLEGKSHEVSQCTRRYGRKAVL